MTDAAKLEPVAWMNPEGIVITSEQISIMQGMKDDYDHAALVHVDAGILRETGGMMTDPNTPTPYDDLHTDDTSVSENPQVGKLERELADLHGQLEAERTKREEAERSTKARFLGILDHKGDEWWYPGRRDLYMTRQEMEKRSDEFEWKDDPGGTGYLWPFFQGYPMLYAEDEKIKLEQRAEAAEQRLATVEAESLKWSQATVELASAWDELGALGPKEPLSWESVARMAMDYAQANIRALATPSGQTAGNKNPAEAGLSEATKD